MNRMTLIGRLTTDGELKYTANQTPVLELTIADTRRHGETFLTSHFKTVLYGFLAQQYAPLCKAGMEVIVLGEYERREWVNREKRRQTSEQLIANYFRITDQVGAHDA